MHIYLGKKYHAIQYSVSVLMPPPTTAWLLMACTKQPKVNSVSTGFNYYQLVSSCLPLQSVKKSPFWVTVQEKWLDGWLWLRSRIRAHIELSEAEQLLGLFQYIYLCINPLALISTISWNQRKSCKKHVWTNKICSHLRLIYHRQWPTLCS